MPFDRVVSHLPQLHDRPLAWATGRAGDVYLCHPFIVHAATWPHRGNAPRFIAQPPLSPVGLLTTESFKRILALRADPLALLD